MQGLQGMWWEPLQLSQSWKWGIPAPQSWFQLLSGQQCCETPAHGPQIIYLTGWNYCIRWAESSQKQWIGEENRWMEGFLEGGKCSWIEQKYQCKCSGPVALGAYWTPSCKGFLKLTAWRRQKGFVKSWAWQRAELHQSMTAMFVLLLSRCPAGDNWWYMGEKCERKGSSQETTVIAVSSTIAVFVVMLIVTVTTAVCLKKKYRKGREEKLTLEDVSILLLSTSV